MPRFFVLDHSLKDIGGHHYEYALQILRAAESSGYEIVLATNVQFNKRAAFPGHWHILAPFRYQTYNRYSVFTRSDPWLPREFRQATTPEPARGLLAPLVEFRNRRGWEKRINNFARGCEQVFRQFPLRAGDQVFLPTASEFDLYCLAQFLQTHPETQNFDWHLQFHFKFFTGRDPEYAAQQDRLEFLRTRFCDALDGIPRHRLHFYTTTEEMSAQYNRLNVGRFQGLPYPTNSAFTQLREHSVPTGSLKLTCPGHIRREKGRQELADLLSELYDECFANGRMQLQIQLSERRFRRGLSTELTQRMEQSSRQNSHFAPVAHIKHPLSKDEYVDFILQSDIALLIYDSDRYYARCSGILVEMLSAGIPVIVPAGCWLSEQIAEPNYRHLEQLMTRLQPVGETTAESLGFAGSSKTCTAELSVPGDATQASVSFRWANPLTMGTYVKIETEQLDDAGNVIERGVTIEGRREANASVHTLTPLVEGAKSLRITWRNCYHDQEITLQDVNYRFWTAPAGVACPVGGVGRIAASPAEIPGIVREMSLHYPHYLQAAREFSRLWSQQHDPQRTIEMLDANAQSRAASSHELAAA